MSDVRMGLFRRNPALSPEAFDSHWLDTHGPLAARLPGLREYWQNLVTDRLQRGIDFKRGPWDFDGISQLWFDEAAQAGQVFGGGPLARALVEDEARFIGELHIIAARQRVVVPVPEPGTRARLLKRLSTLKRLPGLSEEDFRREWIVHGEYVRKMPGIGGYRQNVVTARERVKGRPCDYPELPIDGIVELWFEDTGTLQEAFASPAGRTTMAHARTFLEEITAFVVSERRIL